MTKRDRVNIHKIWQKKVGGYFYLLVAIYFFLIIVIIYSQQFLFNVWIDSLLIGIIGAITYSVDQHYYNLAKKEWGKRSKREKVEKF